MGKNKTFTEDFKREAVKLVESGQSVEQAAIDLGIGKTSLYRWCLQFGKRRETQALASTDEDLRKENARLRKRLREVEEEREILKKATAFFAKESR